jgi:preprotein translocase subunit SecA
MGQATSATDRHSEGTGHLGDLKRCRQVADAVNVLEPELVSRSDGGLRALISGYRARLTGGEPADALMPEVFAAAREAAKRTIGLRHLDQQVMAGAGLQLGAVVELKAGEGKTLAISLPACLNALAGSGVHVLTATDYLAERDLAWMRPLYDFFGAEVSLAGSGDQSPGHHSGYDSDITYGGYSRFGLDYLRDNLAWSRDESVQRGHHVALVDDADHVLIDHARGPLTIRGPADQRAATDPITRLAARMRRGLHYEVDESGQLTLTWQGRTWAADQCGAESPDDPECRALTFGLQDALAAKEGLPVRGEVLAKMTPQDYLRLYGQVAAITAIGAVDAVTYHQVYGLDLICIPAVWPTRRVDLPDALYATTDAKLTALADEVAARHRRGQPVFVGSDSIEESREISRLLTRRDVDHVVADLTTGDGEPPVVDGCGELGAVTVAPMSASFGLDFRLGDGTQAGRDAVARLGGLCVLSAQRREIQRHDQRFRERAGRRGAPGAAKFLVSLQDETVIWLLGRSRVDYLRRLGGESRRAKEVSKLIGNQQRRVADEYHARLVTLDSIFRMLSEQREMIYASRRAAVLSADVGATTRHIVDEVIRQVTETATAEGQGIEVLWSRLRKVYPITVAPGDIAAERGCAVSDLAVKDVADRIIDDAQQAYVGRETVFTKPVMREIERRVTLSVTDRCWRRYLRELDELELDKLPDKAADPRADGALAEVEQSIAAGFAAMVEEMKREVVREIFNVKEVKSVRQSISRLERG